MNDLVQVALKVGHNNGIFTYRVNNEKDPNSLFGKRVKVYLKNRLLTGVVIGEAFEATFKIKNILAVIDENPILTYEQLSLMKFCASYYLNHLGLCVHMATPKNEKRPRKDPIATSQFKEIENLTEEQKTAVETILKAPFGSFLLEGVTGSGKTHVYMSVALKTLQEEKSVLFLVPEIALTPQLVNKVNSLLGANALVMHSNIAPAKKRDIIFKLLDNKSCILIGARSAIFAPLKNLGLIVIDEEHDTSLKQDEAPRYNARDLALWRAKNEHARIILGSATPSLESIYNVARGRLTHLWLKNRFNQNQEMPKVLIIDLKQRQKDVDLRTKDQSKTLGHKLCIISRPLALEIKETLDKKLQVLLFLNQRGYAKFGVCYECGQMVECQSCSVGLTYYQGRNALLCHQCKHTETAYLTCRNCLKEGIRYLGFGTERLEKEVKLQYPNHRVLRLDRDVVRSQRKLEETLDAIHKKQADILIGTQMITKGHDFSHVALVGVICADVTLSMPDFRANEKTFQLLTQVAGRAGRSAFLGKVLIQTFNPSHPSIFYAKDHNVKDFIENELRLRDRFSKPPFVRSALIRCEHKDEKVAQEIINIAKNLMVKKNGLTILGPVLSPIERINNRYRYQCLITANKTTILQQGLKELKEEAFNKIALKSRVRFIIDIDPQNFS